MNSFVIRPLSAENFADCVSLLRENEKSCVSLVSRFVKDGVFSLPEKTTFYHTVYKKTPAGIFLRALFKLSDQGLVLHCIPTSVITNSEERDLFKRAVFPVLKKGNPYCLMGESFGSLLLLEASGFSCSVNREYELFEYVGLRDEKKTGADDSRKSAEFEPVLPPFFKKRRCYLNDAEILYPLQRDYEIEEVLPPGDTHSRLLCMSGLRQTLQTQQVFAVFDQAGKPVAKAGTNALGFSCSQIGGVYTVPEWRGKGLARELTRFLANKLEGEKKHVVLFVKTDNEQAKKAYKNAGFIHAGDYRIIYF